MQLLMYSKTKQMNQQFKQASQPFQTTLKHTKYLKIKDILEINMKGIYSN